MTVSFQNSYPYNMPIGREGDVADCGFKNTLSPVGIGEILPGRGVMKPLNLDYFVMLPRANTASVVISADLVTGNSIAATVNGVVVPPVAFITSSASTMAALATAIENNVPTVISAVASGVNNNTITVISQEGTASAISSFVVTGGASQPTGTVTASQSGTFYGVAQAGYAYQNTFFPLAGPNASISSSTGTPYYNGAIVPTLTQGRIYVIPESVVTSNSPVYLRVTANGANTRLGAFSGIADGANSILIPATSAIWREGNGTVGGLAVLELGIL